MQLKTSIKKNAIAMKTDNVGSNIFLTGCILLANLDLTGLLEYAVKATIGGAVWLGYKVVADWLAERKKKQQQKQL